MGLMVPYISKDLIDFINKTDEKKAGKEIYNNDEEWSEQGMYVEDYVPNKAFMETRCPECNRNHNIIHFECGEYIDTCTCVEGSRDSVYYCNPCDAIWDIDTDEVVVGFSESNSSFMATAELDDIDDPFVYGGGSNPSYKGNKLFDDDEYDFEPYPYYDTNTGMMGTTPVKSKYNKGTTTTTTTGQGQGAWTYTKCTHKHVEMKLADGTPIYCSSVRDKAEDGKKPDFGLYADSIWKPLWRNEFITWPDYGIPTDNDLGLTQIWEAYVRATNGEMVEIGCIGGHGRTGTILAVMQIGAGQGEVTADEAIKYVREKYCDSAIESASQEWYIAYAAATWFGHELPDKPVVTTTGTCSIASHYAMMLRGHKKCQTTNSICQYWNQDVKTYPTASKDAFWTAAAKAKDYDYVYGGVIRFDDDSKTSPCTPLDHYVMIMLGHDHCIRLEDDCNWWARDIEEWKEHKTINNESDWGSMSIAAKELYDIYPNVEQYEAEQATVKEEEKRTADTKAVLDVVIAKALEGAKPEVKQKVLEHPMIVGMKDAALETHNGDKK